VILIADSGATKTDWRFIDLEGRITSFSSQGLSPMFWTAKEMVAEIKKNTPKSVLSKTKGKSLSIYFYGTGCSNNARINIVKSALKSFFKKSSINIYHDILASARALLGHEKGIACILGTGSNSCYYNGTKVTSIIGGHTFILGDEGSGAHLGLSLVKAFLNEELPSEIKKKFVREHHITKEKIYDAIYTKKNPNKFLASYAFFIHENLNNPFIKKMATDCFLDFFDKTICKYKNYKNEKIGFVGSIANNFRAILILIAKKKKVYIYRIINSPIEELVKYHLKFI